MSTTVLQLNIQNLLNTLKSHGLLISAPLLNTQSFDHITYDSRETKTGSLFVCKGFAFKRTFLDMAVENGIAAYLSQEKFDDVDCPCILVNDVRKAMAVLSILYYNHSYEKLTIAGLTGTKGKTTSSYFLHNILNAHEEKKTALLSSVEMYTGDVSVEAHLTTPESLELHHAFSDAVDHNINYLTMEVSSQAYKLSRVYGMTFDYGLFINIGEDHIGPLEHDDFEDYFGCKLDFIRNCKTMVINTQTDHYHRVLDVATTHCEKVITYGITPNCDYYCHDIKSLECGFSFMVTSARGTKEYRIGMAGRFNIENATGAIAMASAMGMDYDEIYKGLLTTMVMGRMNIFQGKDITVIVDYAHNYVSYDKLFQSLKADYPGRRVVVLFGCPGGKAHLRRRDIGTLTGIHADFTYITAEDPQFENVREICDDIAKYVAPHTKNYVIIEDREEAIRTVMAQAQPGDVIVLAGKGEEVYQKVNGEYAPYISDYTLAEVLVKERDNGVN